MPDPITYNHGTHWSVEAACGPDGLCEGAVSTPHSTKEER